MFSYEESNRPLRLMFSPTCSAMFGMCRESKESYRRHIYWSLHLHKYIEQLCRSHREESIHYIVALCLFCLYFFFFFFLFQKRDFLSTINFSFVRDRRVCFVYLFSCLCAESLCLRRIHFMGREVTERAFGYYFVWFLFFYLVYVCVCIRLT